MPETGQIGVCGQYVQSPVALEVPAEVEFAWGVNSVMVPSLIKGPVM